MPKWGEPQAELTATTLKFVQIDADTLALENLAGDTYKSFTLATLNIKTSIILDNNTFLEWLSVAGVGQQIAYLDNSNNFWLGNPFYHADDSGDLHLFAGRICQLESNRPAAAGWDISCIHFVTHDDQDNAFEQVFIGGGADQVTLGLSSHPATGSSQTKHSNNLGFSAHYWDGNQDVLCLARIFYRMNNTNPATSIHFNTTVPFNGSEIKHLTLTNNNGVAWVGFYDSYGCPQQVLPTGASKTPDDIITALQNLGLVKQS